MKKLGIVRTVDAGLGLSGDEEDNSSFGSK
jgi:hypothetical protein